MTATGLLRVLPMTWTTGFRGEILLHASNTIDVAECERLAGYPRWRDWLARTSPRLHPRLLAGEWWRLPHGGIVGSAELFDVFDADERVARRGPDDFEYLPRNFPGKNRFVFRSAKSLERPWHCPGGSRLFEVEEVEEVEEKFLTPRRKWATGNAD
jgi:hypothetical protein